MLEKMVIGVVLQEHISDCPLFTLLKRGAFSLLCPMKLNLFGEVDNRGIPVSNRVMQLVITWFSVLCSSC